MILLVLAMTSTQRAVRWLGGKGWAQLHRCVYLAAVAALVHYWWLVKPGVLTPLGFTAAMALLLLARPLTAWGQRRSAAKP